MNIKLASIILLISFMFCSCFKDEGNYDYKSINEPTFDFKLETINGYVGENMKCKAQFFFSQADSVELMENALFEWKINNILISEEKDLDVPVDDIVKILKLERLPSKSMTGSFSVKDKRTDISHLYKLNFYLKPQFDKGSWVILSKNNGKSKLSCLKWTYFENEDGNHIDKYEIYDGIFKNKNDNKDIPGNPIMIRNYEADHISGSIGATTVLTDEVAWDVNNETFRFAYDIKEEFINGAPSDLKIKDFLYDNYNNSFILDENGSVYYRRFSKNHIGHDYINSPYVFDDKESNIEFFGSTSVPFGVSYMYDKQNNRILGYYKGYPVKPLKEGTGTSEVDLANLDENKEILMISSNINNIKGNARRTYNGLILYKEDGKNYVYEFVTKKISSEKRLQIIVDKTSNYEFTGNLAEDSKIWSPSITFDLQDFYKYAIFYTNGNELRYFDRKSKEDHLIKSFDSKITAVKFDTYTSWGDGWGAYKRMAIGLENGYFCLMDMRNEEPVIIKETETDFGGEIVDLSVIGGRSGL